jgi:hypothetical protein
MLRKFSALALAALGTLMAGGNVSAGPFCPTNSQVPFFDIIPGGTVAYRTKDQTIWSFGGVLLPRCVTVTEADGTVTKFKYPPVFCPMDLHNIDYARGVVTVGLPDDRGLLYVNGEEYPRRGRTHVVRTELLEAGRPTVFELRAAFRSGNELLVEERTITALAGATTVVTFDGSKAQRVKLPPLPEGFDELPPPRPLQAQENGRGFPNEAGIGDMAGMGGIDTLPNGGMPPGPKGGCNKGCGIFHSRCTARDPNNCDRHPPYRPGPPNPNWTGN